MLQGLNPCIYIGFGKIAYWHRNTAQSYLMRLKSRAAAFKTLLGRKAK